MNANLLKSEKNKKLFSLLFADINLLPYLREKDNEMSKLYEKYGRDYFGEVKSYRAFTRLAIVYEKIEDYINAADVCAQAIQLGIVKDGTNGGMQGRLARICKKGELNLTDYINIDNI